MRDVSLHSVGGGRGVEGVESDKIATFSLQCKMNEIHRGKLQPV